MGRRAVAPAGGCVVFVTIMHTIAMEVARDTASQLKLLSMPSLFSFARPPARKIARIMRPTSALIK